MNHISEGLGGRGVVVKHEEKRHPKSHFEIDEMRIKKAHDGSYVMRHDMRLKKRHENKEGFVGGYMEPETHTAANEQELMAHVKKHFGKAMPSSPGAQAEPDADDQ